MVLRSTHANNGDLNLDPVPTHDSISPLGRKYFGQTFVAGSGTVAKIICILDISNGQ